MKAFYQIGIFILLCFGIWYFTQKQKKPIITDNSIKTTQKIDYKLGFQNPKITSIDTVDNGITKKNYAYFPVKKGDVYEYFYSHDEAIKFLGEDYQNIVYIIDDKGQKIGETSTYTDGLTTLVHPGVYKIKLKIVDANMFGIYTIKK